MTTLEGKVAIVTGAGRGIGAAIAKHLADAGAAVVVNDLGAGLDGTGTDAGPAAEVASAIEAAGGRAVVDPTDVSDFDAVEAMVQRAVETFGGLDIVVNVAGILRDRMIFNMSEEDFDSVVRVHLKGTFNTSRHAAAHWRTQRNDQGQFRIVNFTSDTGLFGGPTQANYAAAKMGIVGLTLSCANALARYGVTANAVAPVADTRMTEDVSAGTTKSAPIGGRSPDAVARLVQYLASPHAQWCSGRVLGVRGNEISLFSNPVVVRHAVSADTWAPDALGDVLQRHFGSFPQGSEGRYQRPTGG